MQNINGIKITEYRQRYNETFEQWKITEHGRRAKVKWVTSKNNNRKEEQG